MTAAASDVFGKLFTISGRPLLFDLGLIKQDELLRELTRTIRDFGGKVVTPQDADKGPRHVLYDQNEDVLGLLSSLARRPDRICLKWDWILDCHEKGRIVTENDYSGNRFVSEDGPPTDASLDYAELLGTEYPNRTNQSTASTSTGRRFRSPSVPRTPFSPAASTSYDPHEHVSPGETGASARAQGPGGRPHKRKREESSTTQPKKAKPSNDESMNMPDKGEEEDIDGVALPELESAETYLPPPPTKLVKNSWFGYDYTDDDYEYMKQCITIICEKHHDPDFKQLWKDMGKLAKHHNGAGWKHFFGKNESKLAGEIPALRRLYESSDDENTPKKKVAKAAHRPAWKPKEVFKDRSVEEKVSEDDRRKLIRFMADAPEGGITQEELLQNFCRMNTHHSWRTWRRLILDNKASFERAVARRRELNKNSGLHT